jgi:hypothetical protein
MLDSSAGLLAPHIGDTHAAVARPGRGGKARSVVKTKFRPSVKQWIALVIAWGAFAIVLMPTLASL